MSKVIDMTGQKYGYLTILERAENDKHGKAQWWCQCDCGSPKKIINGAAIRRGLVVSCGCKKNKEMQKYNQSNVINQIGNRYGKLLVISRNTDSKNSDGRAMWNCQCDCGNTCVVSGKLLRDHHVASCGCGIKSIGEKAISELLTITNINFCQQYKVSIQQNIYEQIQKHPYYFDFAIFQNNILKYLIQYDGQQHYQYKDTSSFWNTEENYNKTKIRDNIKNQWCKDNHIPLIRIPYYHLKDLCIEDLLLETSKFII